MLTPSRAPLTGVPWELLTLPAFPTVSAKALQLLSGSDTRLLELYPAHPGKYDELLQELPLAERRMFTFDPKAMARTIAARMEVLDAV